MTDLAYLKGLIEKATKGPWFQGYGAEDELWNGDSESRHKIWPDHLGVGRIIARTGTNFTGWVEQDDANAALITAAVNSLPDLIGEVERLRGLLGEGEQFASATLAAMDEYNKANGTYLIGPSLLQLGKFAARARAALGESVA